GARRLGLDGEVAPADLRLVLAGVSPDGEILTAGRVAEASRVSGFDLTWSAPKSVSLLYGLSDPVLSGTVRAVHEEAVTQALGYLERRAFVVRRGAGGEHQMGANGMVAAAFVHRTSRAGDPQLHSHVLVANVAQGDDGAWSAPDARLLYHHARTAGFLYQAALRAGLGEDLGVRFGPVRAGMAELDGVPKDLLRGFSTRRREIEYLLSATGATSARSAEVAALVTRKAKEPPPDDVEAGQSLRERWLEQARVIAGAGRLIDVGLLGPVVGRERWAAPSSSEVDGLVVHLLGPEGLTAHASAFERRDIARAIAEGLPRGAPVADIEALADRVLARPEVVALPSVGPGAELRHTTLELLVQERSLLDTAVRLQRAGSGLAGSLEVAAALAQFSLLSDEQVAMVERLTRSGAGVDVVVGQAGTGKTLALAAARASWESSAYEVLGTALSARAARGLADGAGIESRTLAKLFSELGSGALVLGPGHVLVVDEAGMVGTRSLGRLIEAAEIADAKVVLVGDPRQLPEIEAGGALAALVARIGAVELTENRRQVERWERLALSALRHGRSEVALATYGRAGRVHTAPSVREAQALLVGSWAHAFGQGRDALMLAVARTEVAGLNELARETLRRSGSLGEDLIEVDGRGFALGDKVVCLRNDARLGVLNGTTGIVERAAGSALVVSTTDGERLVPRPYLEAGHLAHGYALTVHKSQGLTVDLAYVLATESLTREAGYVAMSRAREASELFVPLGPSREQTGHDLRPRQSQPMADLARRLASSRAKHLAVAELDAGSAPHDGGAAHPVVLPERSGPDQVPPGNQLSPEVYREAPKMEVGHVSHTEDPTPDEAEPLRRFRGLDDAMKLAQVTRERTEAERGRPGRTPDDTERDRSWGRSR
ncbi:MAG TPA: MobF family relaxase, partial [Acidimicrobiales bacterium]|nr:MobF family relaxase [Acidimicrobiales bacterium]